MSERLTAHHSPEKTDHQHLERLARDRLQELQEKARATEAPTSKHVEHLAHKAQEQAVSGHEYTVGERDAAPASHTFGTHKELKHQSYKRILRHVQSRLQGPEKSFSKVIHGKQVEKASNFGAQTIARPSGLMAAGLTTFLGSLTLLFLAKRYGFRYNFSFFIVLFVIGYGLGLLVEGLAKLGRKQ